MKMMKRMKSYIILLTLQLLLYRIHAIAPCTGEAADVCGFLPSTYSELGFPGFPAACAPDLPNCTIDEGFDRCRVCGGVAPINPVLFEPLGLAASSRMGGEIAQWNGTALAISQHIVQVLTPLVEVPVITWTLDFDPMAVPGTYTFFQLPTATSELATDGVPPGKGFALEMSENHLVIGAHDSSPRVVELWTRTIPPSNPWSQAWTAHDPCPGNHFGWSVGIDERVPRLANQGVFGTVVAGDPGAFFSGRVYVYFTYSPALHQQLSFGFGNETERACFGHSVNADSGYLAIGAPALDVVATSNAGSVFIWQWDPDVGLQGEYVFRSQIIPPFPAVNLGFGTDVAVWDDLLVVGDNHMNVYLYKLVGIFVIPLSLPPFFGINLVSRLGYTVSIWDQRIAAGDENFVSSASSRGVAFIWEENPVLPSFYRRIYELVDDLDTFHTQFGAEVDLRGGCYLGVGVPGELPLGGGYLISLCRGDCIGCDDILNSCLAFDECGVCNGTNTTCLDCNGVINGPDIADACDVCEGTNTTCVNPIVDPLVLPCNTSQVVELHHQFENQHGPATWEVVDPLAENGDAVIQGSGTLIANLTYTSDAIHSGADNVTVKATIISTNAMEIFKIPVTIGLCIDCLGVVNGTTLFDECGVCGGNNSFCLGKFIFYFLFFIYTRTSSGRSHL